MDFQFLLGIVILHSMKPTQVSLSWQTLPINLRWISKFINYKCCVERHYTILLYQWKLQLIL